MDSITDLPGKQPMDGTMLAGSVKHQDAPVVPARRIVGITLLIPLQLYAVLNILLIGYSRVVEGSHWLTDALGGYLAGVLWLLLLIFLYHWTLDRLTKWYAKRLLEKSTQTQVS